MHNDRTSDHSYSVHNFLQRGVSRDGSIRRYPLETLSTNQPGKEHSLPLSISVTRL